MVQIRHLSHNEILMWIQFGGVKISIEAVVQMRLELKVLSLTDG